MFGLFATTLRANDGSAAWPMNYNDAYKYVSEAWGGYHFNVNHGLNIDAGIFVSYIGLFSYYNFDIGHTNPRTFLPIRRGSSMACGYSGSPPRNED